MSQVIGDLLLRIGPDDAEYQKIEDVLVSTEHGLQQLQAAVEATDVAPLTEATTQLGSSFEAAGTAVEPLVSTLSELAAQTQESQDAFDQALSVFNDAVDAFDNGEISAQTYAAALDQLQGAAEEAGVELEGTGEEAQHAGEGAAEAEGKFADLGEQLLKITEIVGLGLGLEELASEAISAAAKVEDLTTSFTFLSGDVGKAAAQVDTLKEMAVSLSEPFDSVAAAAQKMTAQLGGFQNAAPLLTLAADASHVMGTSFENAANALDKMVLSGNAGAKVLANLGISTGDLAAAMGVATDKVKAAFASLDESEKIAVLETALGKFAGASQQFAQNIGESWSNFKTTFELDIEEAGNAIAPFLATIEQAFLSIADSVRPAATALAGFIAPALAGEVQNLADSVHGLASAFTTLTASLAPVQPVLDSLAGVFEKLTGMGIGEFFQGLAQQVVGFVTGLGPLTDIITQVAAVMEIATHKGLSWDAAILAVTTDTHQMIPPTKEAADLTDTLAAAHEKAATAASKHSGANKEAADSIAGVNKAATELQKVLDIAQATFDKLNAGYATGATSAAQLGEAIKNLDAAHKAYNDTIDKAIDKNKTVVDTFTDLTNDMAAGRISVEDYAKAISDVVKPTEEFVQSMGDTQNSLVDVNGKTQLVTGGLQDFDGAAQHAGGTIENLANSQFVEYSSALQNATGENGSLNDLLDIQITKLHDVQTAVTGVGDAYVYTDGELEKASEFVKELNDEWGQMAAAATAAGEAASDAAAATASATGSASGKGGKGGGGTSLSTESYAALIQAIANDPALVGYLTYGGAGLGFGSQGGFDASSNIQNFVDYFNGTQAAAKAISDLQNSVQNATTAVDTHTAAVTASTSAVSAHTSATQSSTDATGQGTVNMRLLGDATGATVTPLGAFATNIQAAADASANAATTIAAAFGTAAEAADATYNAFYGVTTGVQHASIALNDLTVAAEGTAQRFATAAEAADATYNAFYGVTTGVQHASIALDDLTKAVETTTQTYATAAEAADALYNQFYGVTTGVVRGGTGPSGGDLFAGKNPGSAGWSPADNVSSALDNLANHANSAALSLNGGLSDHAYSAARSLDELFRSVGQLGAQASTMLLGPTPVYGSPASFTAPAAPSVTISVTGNMISNQQAADDLAATIVTKLRLQAGLKL